MTRPRIAVHRGLAALPLLLGIAAACHVDRLFHSPTGGGPAPARLVFTSQPSRVMIGDPISVRITAQDSAGMPLPDFTGPVTVALDSNPGAASLGGTTQVNAVDGVATFGDLSIDKAGSGYTLQASASGIQATSAPFDVAVPTPPPPQATHLGFTDQPQTTQAGSTMAVVQVAALDDSGSVVTAFTGSITVSIAANPGGATLSGTRAVTATNGIATFSDLSMDKAGTAYTLRAATSGLVSATSAAFDITAPPPPPPPAVALKFSVQPSNAYPMFQIYPAVQVAAVDANGNVVTGFTGQVTIAIGHDASVLGGATLSGTKTVTATNGVATFSDLSIDQPGVGYTLVASASGGRLAGVESAKFTILTP
jgi:hypothetical protein